MNIILSFSFYFTGGMNYSGAVRSSCMWETSVSRTKYISNRSEKAKDDQQLLFIVSGCPLYDGCIQINKDGKESPQCCRCAHLSLLSTHTHTHAHLFSCLREIRGCRWTGGLESNCDATLRNLLFFFIRNCNQIKECSKREWNTKTE